MTKSASQGTRDEVVEMQSSVGHDGCIGSCVSLVLLMAENVIFVVFVVGRGLEAL